MYIYIYIYTPLSIYIYIYMYIITSTLTYSHTHRPLSFANSIHQTSATRPAARLQVLEAAQAGANVRFSRSGSGLNNDGKTEIYYNLMDMEMMEKH